MKLWSQLRWQLLLSYVPVILLPVLIVGFVTRGAAEQGLTVMINKGAHDQADVLARCFATYYENHGSWDGLAALLKPQPRRMLLPPPPGSDSSPVSVNVVSGSWFEFKVNCYTGAIQDRLARPGLSIGSRPAIPASSANAPLIREPGPILFNIRDVLSAGETFVADTSGMVVASSTAKNIGQPLSVSAISQGVPIVVNDAQVGTLAIGATFNILEQQKHELLDNVNLALFVSGAMSILLAIALGWRLSWQIAFPLSQLRAGVKKLSTGEWSAPLKVRSQNEFAELTQAFNTMANEVTRQQRLTRQMVADVAHDLRTPLSVMMLEIEAIEAGFQTPAEATDSLRKEITWLQRLVEDLRLLSLMDADQIHLQQERTPLYPFLCGVMDFWQISADEAGRALVLNAPTTLPDVAIDAGRMRQILGNLIDNAIQHTKHGGNIVLGAHADSSSIAIWVSDDGEGIAPVDLPHVFDRFYRADRSRGRSKSGSGLGLSISRRLVEMHGGTIGVSSTPGQGTIFTIRIPLKTAESKEKPAHWVRTLEARQRAAV